MKPLDDELKSALRRVEPPPGFADRVLVRAHGETETRAGFWPSLGAFFASRRLRWAVGLGFACVLVIFGAIRYREHQEAKMQAQIAGAQARLALQIASTKLNAVLRDATRPGRSDTEN